MQKRNIKQQAFLALVAIISITILVYQNFSTPIPETTESPDEGLAAKKRAERRDAINPGWDQESQDNPRETGLRENIRQDAGEQEAELSQAVNLLHDGHVDEAEALLTTMLKKNPNRHDILAELAMIKLLDRKNPQEAIKYLKRALISDPSNGGLSEETAKTFIQLNQIPEGLQFFKNLLAVHIKLTSLNFVLAQLYAGQKNWDAARSALEPYINDSGLEPKALALRGQINVATGQAEKGRDDLEKAAAGLEALIIARLKNQEDIVLQVEILEQTMFRLADVLFSLKDYDRAASVVAKLSERIPDDPRVIALQDEIFKIKGMSSF